MLSSDVAVGAAWAKIRPNGYVGPRSSSPVASSRCPLETAHARGVQLMLRVLFVRKRRHSRAVCSAHGPRPPRSWRPTAMPSRRRPAPLEPARGSSSRRTRLSTTAPRPTPTAFPSCWCAGESRGGLNCASAGTTRPAAVATSSRQTRAPRESTPTNSLTSRARSTASRPP